MKTLAVVVAVAAVLYLALHRNHSRQALSLPGADVLEAARRLGWACRPDPFQVPGAGYYFLAEGAPGPDVWLKGGVHPRVLHLRQPAAIEVGIAEDDETHDMIAGWEVRGDAQMKEALARELGR